MEGPQWLTFLGKVMMVTTITITQHFGAVIIRGMHLYQCIHLLGVSVLKNNNVLRLGYFEAE